MELAVKLLKHRLKSDHTTFVGHTLEFNQIKELITRTSEQGESNSALIIGPLGCGKTTLIASVLSKLIPNNDFRANTLMVNLNGYIHTDDALALKSITKQLNLETAVNGKVFTTFAENLAFLLDCLRSGDRLISKSAIFVLEEFDLFCGHANQTLIYNLFDVAQSAQAPICVIGLTRRYDVIELMEKRVKSRFSHRQIFLFDENGDSDTYLNNFLDLLRLPNIEKVATNEYVEIREHCKTSSLQLLRNDFDVTIYRDALKKDFITKWNKEINGLAKNEMTVSQLMALFNHNASLAILKNIAFTIVANINDLKEAKPTITTSKLAHIIHKVIDDGYLRKDSKVEMMCDLSILEMSLIIAMKHHNDIYDRDPFNFEIILTRLHKFQNSSEYSMGNYNREVVLKAFDVLKHIGLIVAIGNSTKDLKEFQMHKLLVQNHQVDKAVSLYKNLPTQIMQWSRSSQI